MLTVKEKADNSDLKTAQRFNEEALAIAPEDSSVLLTCAHIYSHIGNNLGNPDYNSEGRIEEALNVLRKALSIRQKLADRDPGNTLYKNNLGVSLKDMGDIYSAKGDVENAIDNYNQALAIHQDIADDDAKNANAQGTVAYDLTKLGNALLVNGEVNSALTKHEKSVAMLERMYIADAGNVMVAHTLALSLEGFADSCKAQKDFAKALTIYQRSLQIEEELNSFSETPEFQINIAQLYFKLGQTRQLFVDSRPGNKTVCQDLRDDFQRSIDAFSKIQKLVELGPSNLQILSEARQYAEKLRLTKTAAGCG